AGHSATTTANINVTSVHHESLSTENDAHHPGVALLHNGGTAGHDVAWGNGDDVLFTDTHFTKAGAPVQDGVLDMGAGNNTVHLGATNISFTGDDAHHLKNVDNL